MGFSPCAQELAIQSISTPMDDTILAKDFTQRNEDLHWLSSGPSPLPRGLGEKCSEPAQTIPRSNGGKVQPEFHNSETRDDRHVHAAGHLLAFFLFCATTAWSIQDRTRVHGYLPVGGPRLLRRLASENRLRDAYDNFDTDDCLDSQPSLCIRSFDQLQRSNNLRVQFISTRHGVGERTSRHKDGVERLLPSLVVAEGKIRFT